MQRLDRCSPTKEKLIDPVAVDVGYCKRECKGDFVS